jgi:hypothetical protein
MVYVRLAQDWTDGDGVDRAAGDMVDVDAVTLAELEADGTVASADKGDDVTTAAWPGPTSPPPPPPGEVIAAAWPGPTSPPPPTDPAI